MLLKNFQMCDSYRDDQYWYTNHVLAADTKVPVFVWASCAVLCGMEQNRGPSASL